MDACYTNMYVASQNKNIITHMRPATLNRSDLKEKKQVHATHSLGYKLWHIEIINQLKNLHNRRWEISAQIYAACMCMHVRFVWLIFSLFPLFLKLKIDINIYFLYYANNHSNQRFTVI